MTDYSTLSDFEINKMVCDVFWPDFSKSSECKNKTFPQNSSIVYMENGYGGFSRDYCNNPADAWPIIVKNHISICSYVIHNPGMVRREYWEADVFTENKCTDKNPLRAAMIVFLMMQEKIE